jgi:hypothetical protein
MRYLGSLPLSSISQTVLLAVHNEVCSEPSFHAQVELAVKKWDSKGSSTQGKLAFHEIKKLLQRMGNSHDNPRCHYCETSVADEIEHVFPKTLFPEKCFQWDNYLYVCGPCNGPKNNKFAVFNSKGELVRVPSRPRPRKGQPPTLYIPPPSGRPAIINPRLDDPVLWLKLDLWRGEFIPVSEDKESEDYILSKYVIDELINLNRAPLPTTRKNVFKMLLTTVISYVAQPNLAQNHESTIVNNVHRVVWLEMKRQKVKPLDVLFANCEELLNL